MSDNMYIFPTYQEFDFILNVYLVHSHAGGFHSIRSSSVQGRSTYIHFKRGRTTEINTKSDVVNSKLRFIPKKHIK